MEPRYKKQYVVVLEIKNEFHSDPLRPTYLNAYYVAAHDPSEAASQVVDRLSVNQAVRIVRTRAMLVDQIPEVNYPKVELRW